MTEIIKLDAPIVVGAGVAGLTVALGLPQSPRHQRSRDGVDVVGAGRHRGRTLFDGLAAATCC